MICVESLGKEEVRPHVGPKANTGMSCEGLLIARAGYAPGRPQISISRGWGLTVWRIEDPGSDGLKGAMAPYGRGSAISSGR